MAWPLGMRLQMLRQRRQDNPLYYFERLDAAQNNKADCPAGAGEAFEDASRAARPSGADDHFTRRFGARLLGRDARRGTFRPRLPDAALAQPRLRRLLPRRQTEGDW